MNYKKIDKSVIEQFTRIIGKEQVLTGHEETEPYSRDETEDLIFFPEAVLRPRTPEEVSAILRICSSQKIPVTPRGAGTGLSGGALAVCGGIVLSTEKMNRILDIDEHNLQVTVEPGVITEVLQNAVKGKGLFYPPDPSSRGSCFIGGNVMENAGGPKAVKYGVTADYILNLQAVLPSGEIIWTGANVLKNATGYNLTQLLTGSEGTLAVITCIVLKIIPLPSVAYLLAIPFSSAEKACEAVSAIFRAGITPSGLEFMERDAIILTMNFAENARLPLTDDTAAYLLAEVDGNDEQALMYDCEKISEVVKVHGCGEILFAQTAREQEALWSVRRKIAEAVKANSVYKEEDTVVPRAELPKLLGGVKELGVKYGFRSVCYGHAGDGNLHVNIIKGDMSEEKWKRELPEAIRELFQLCVKLGGTISGEHGIGWVQKPYMNIAFSPSTLSLCKEIKRAFDPNGIMNPGKIW